MGVCGGSAPKQKESASEKEYALQAAKRLTEWKQDGYEDLEKDAIADSNVDVSELIKGRTNADAEQTAAGLGQAIPATGGVQTLASAIRDLTGSKRIALDKAQKTAQEYKVNKQLTTAKTGQDVQGLSAASLSSTANNAARTSAAEVQNKVLQSQAKGAALASIVSGGVAGYARTQTPSTAFDQVKYDTALQQGKGGAGAHATWRPR